MTTIRPARESSADLIRRLIAFDTVSRHSNLELIDWIRNYLEDHGVESQLIFDETGKKANLFATIGRPDRAGYVLSGHTDVVPIDGQDWSSDPFKVREADGRYYARGASDMKSFIAIALGAVPDLVKTDLTRPIHLAFSYDEEVGCRGAPSLSAHMQALETPPLLCIIGEPTEMNVVIAHKGNVRYRCTVAGHECHSALTHQGANAVEAAAELVAKLKTMARRKRDQGPFDAAYEPPYTTLHTGTINGGTAVNIVPNACQFDFEIRYVPADDPADLMAELQGYARATIEPEMQRISAETGVAFTLRSTLAPLDTPADSLASEFARTLAQRSDTRKISFGTEGGIFSAAGLQTVVCGPGSIDQAHKPDEWIAIDQVQACEAFMVNLRREASR